MVFLTEIERQRVFQSGLLEGEQKGRIESAKEMLARGMELRVISEVTKLPEAQILELRDGLPSMKK